MLPNLIPNISVDRPKHSQNGSPVMGRQCILYQEMGNGVDIPSDRPTPQFGDLADSRPTSHERVENNLLRNSRTSVEKVQDVRPRRRKCGNRNRPEHGAQPVRPPFVDMVDRAVDFLTPTLRFGDSTQLLKWKIFFLDGPRAISRGDKDICRSAAEQVKLPRSTSHPRRHLHARPS